jgi:enterochelin esterase family protein
MRTRSKRFTTGLPLMAVAMLGLSMCGPPVRDVPQSATESPDDRYVLGEDSLPQPGVPAGTVSEFILADSKTYPGYSHNWWLYVPTQYDGKTPIALMAFQDGGGLGFVQRDGEWRVPVVLDNLIHKKELPVMAAVFVDPGEPIHARLWPDQQRSFEYDTLSDQYARFLVSEILPEVEKRVRITDNPEGRGIAGRSSGGICAFTVAWHRPDEFRKVFSANGSFVDIRGGDAYPDLIRQSPRKPLRVFLQDGVLDKLGGRFRGLDWPGGNRAMSAALKMQGYDHQLVMGEGTHSGRHGAAIFPDAMRWLWRDYRAE